VILLAFDGIMLAGGDLAKWFRGCRLLLGEKKPTK
jgi:hypothetical protein